jgi:hypothetical protein
MTTSLPVGASNLTQRRNRFAGPEAQGTNATETISQPRTYILTQTTLPSDMAQPQPSLRTTARWQNPAFLETALAHVVTFVREAVAVKKTARANAAQQQFANAQKKEASNRSESSRLTSS